MASTGVSRTSTRSQAVTTGFSEVMSGSIRLAGEESERPLRLELTAVLPGLLHPLTDRAAVLQGRVHVPGWADDATVSGTLEIAPVRRRRVGYRLDFATADGHRMRLDGSKSVQALRPVRSMTTLPVTVTDAEGHVVGTGLVRFNLVRALGPMLGSLRVTTRPGAPEPASLLAPRWRGQPGRLEAWYTTLTDPATGTGLWLHHELVAPADGQPARAHGWVAVFPPYEQPSLARFGPYPWSADAQDEADDDTEPVFAVPGVEAAPGWLRGKAGEISWDLTASGGGTPLFTFPRWAWEREALPGAQVVPQPAAVFYGSVHYAGTELGLDAAPGATAHLYGHGNAHRWAWLHADLGDGDTCEIVAAVSTRPGLRRLAPMTFLRLRVDGLEWPAPDPLLAAPRMRARIGHPTWTVTGRSGDRRINVRVTQPGISTVAVDYTDPDGSPAVCRNSERADAVIRLEQRRGKQFELERAWRLDGTAHAEVGTRD